MYCSALLCLIRLAPSSCLLGLAERDATAQIVWCTRNAKVLSELLTVNSRDDPHPACLLMKVGSKHCNHKQSFIHIFQDAGKN